MASEEKPATNMRDVQSHFRDCLHIHEADGSQIMLYFSVKRNGQIFGGPRAVWYGSDVGAGDKIERILSDFVRAFESCMPLSAQQSHGRSNSRQSLLPSIQRRT